MVKSEMRCTICGALALVGDSESELRVACFKLESYVRCALGSSVYLEKWCARNGFPEYSTVTALSAKPARLRWIDWMIECLKEDLRNVDEKES